VVRPDRPAPVHSSAYKLRTAVTVRHQSHCDCEVEECSETMVAAWAKATTSIRFLAKRFAVPGYRLRGETMDAGTPVRSTRDRALGGPASIALAGHGLLRARVFPIAAGETRDHAALHTNAGAYRDAPK
jgi:hypothetical protein